MLLARLRVPVLMLVVAHWMTSASVQSRGCFPRNRIAVCSCDRYRRLVLSL